MDSTDQHAGLWIFGRYVKSIDDVVPQREPDPREEIISESVEGARVTGALRQAARQKFDASVREAWATREALMKATLEAATATRDATFAALDAAWTATVNAAETAALSEYQAKLAEASALREQTIEQARATISLEARNASAKETYLAALQTAIESYGTTYRQLLNSREGAEQAAKASYKAALEWAEQNLADEGFKNVKKSLAAATFAEDRLNPSLSYTEVYNAYKSAVEWAEDNLAGAPFWNAKSEAKALLDSTLAAIAAEHDAAAKALRDVDAKARSAAHTSFKTAVASAASELEPFILDADAAKEAAFQAARAQYIAAVGSARASADAIREPARAEANTPYRDELKAAEVSSLAAFEAAVAAANVVYNAAIDEAVIEGLAAVEFEKRRQERELAAAKRRMPRVFPQW